MTEERRRNGQLSACEPCRRSKLRCDHTKPTCSRCIRRKIQPRCYYHPAPMAQRSVGGNRDAVSTRNNRTSSNSLTDILCTPLPPAASSVDSELDDEFSRGTGLVMMHSTLMPFTEDSVNSNRPYAALSQMGVSIPRFVFNPMASLLQEGTCIIQYLLDFPQVLEQQIQKQCTEERTLADGSIPFVQQAAWVATQDFIDKLRMNPSPDAMQDAVHAIFQRTAASLDLPSTGADQALEKSFSGRNMRWEMMGLRLILIGQFITSRRDIDSRVCSREQWIPHRKKTMLATFEFGTQCLNYCDRLDQVNDLTLWLTVLLGNLATWCFGDDSFRAWSLVGKVASNILALNFHRGFQSGNSPIFLTEMRRRLLCFANEQDKGFATFAGRPPQLNRRYMKVEPPLDITDTELLGPVEDIHAAIANLDENGWSSRVEMHPGARTRIASVQVSIREEVLEIAFSPISSHQEQQAQQILAKSAAAWAAIPYKTYEVSMWDIMSSNDVMTAMALKLQHLYTEFLLHKLLLSKGEHYREQLIKTSHEILLVVLSALKKGDALVANWVDLEWFTVFYAMPCASVLILELSRQSRQPHPSSILNRSKIIQDISVLISSCDWLTQSEMSNYQVCKKAQEIFSKALDQVLNQPSSLDNRLNKQQELHPTAGNAGEIDGTQPSLVDPDFGLSELFPQNSEFSSWLESINMPLDPWLNMEEV